MKSDDIELLLNLASMFNRLADIVMQRLPEYRKEGSDEENRAMLRVNRLRQLSERQFQVLSPKVLLTCGKALIPHHYRNAGSVAD